MDSKLHQEFPYRVSTHNIRIPMILGHSIQFQQRKKHFKFSPIFGSKIKGFPYPRSSKNSVFSQKINLLQIAPTVPLQGVYSQHTHSNDFSAFYSLLPKKEAFQVFTRFWLKNQRFAISAVIKKLSFQPKNQLTPNCTKCSPIGCQLTKYTFQ